MPPGTKTAHHLHQYNISIFNILWSSCIYLPVLSTAFRIKMIGRYVQLFMLASMVLLLPSLFYLSRQHQDYSIAKDYSLMQTHSYEENGKDWEKLSQQNQVQGSQGHGPPPALDPEIAQSWKFSNVWHGLGLGNKQAGKEVEKAKEAVSVQTTQPVVSEGVIMPKMVNATAKAELGRATWRFLHTMTLRFPEKPTQSDRDTLLRFMTDFSRLYPCGECAEHFQQLLKELPPQTGSRMNAALWLCSAHNKVNERLGKPEFPCDKLDETYDCGCGDDKKSSSSSIPIPATTAV